MNEITTQQAFEKVKSGEMTLQQFEEWFYEKTQEACFDYCTVMAIENLRG